MFGGQLHDVPATSIGPGAGGGVAEPAVGRIVPTDRLEPLDQQLL